MKPFKEWLKEQREKGMKEIRIPKEYLRKAEKAADIGIDWDVVEASVWAKKFFEEIEKSREKELNGLGEEKDL